MALAGVLLHLAGVASIGLLTPRHVSAQVVCPRAASGTITKIIGLKDTPNYFLRAAPDTREISFASAEKDANRVLNVDTEQVTPVPGTLDPVLSRDGRLLSVPQSVLKDQSGLHVVTGEAKAYDFKISGAQMIDPTGKPRTIDRELLKDPTKKILYDDALIFYNREASGKLNQGFIEPNAGNYQSIGLLKKGDQESIYRMLVSRDTDLMIRDYRRDAKTGTLVPASEFRPPCKTAWQAGLPVLSPDGRAFSFYDFKASTTKIMAFNDHGGCDQVDAIPAMVGKPDFSPDGRHLAFHFDRKLDPQNLMFKTPSKDQKLALYLYDRERKSLTVLHDDPKTNSYYPVFMNDREIAYLEQARDPNHPKMSIHLMKIESPAGFPCRGCDTTATSKKASVLLGYLFGERCGRSMLLAGNARAALESLSPENCRGLIAEISETKLRKVQTQLDRRVNWDIFDNGEGLGMANPGRWSKSSSPRIRLADLAAVCAKLTAPATSPSPSTAQ